MITRRRSGVPNLMSDWLRPGWLFDRDPFDLDDIIPDRLGVSVPSVNVKETPGSFCWRWQLPASTRRTLT